MLTRGLFLLVFVMAAATNFLAGASTAQAADVSCSGTLGGGATVTNINGNVKVPDNASCTLNFVNVTGNVQAGHGSTLLITAYTEPSTIGGNVQATQCTSALLRRQCHGRRKCADPTVQNLPFSFSRYFQTKFPECPSGNILNPLNRFNSKEVT